MGYLPSSELAPLCSQTEEPGGPFWYLIQMPKNTHSYSEKCGFWVLLIAQLKPAIPKPLLKDKGDCKKNAFAYF